jgi:hypothetical protein
MISRIDEQPTPLDKPLFRFRHFYKDRRSGQDRRRGSTMMDPAMDRRKRERRKYRTDKNSQII